jgi:hypothetical protein
MVDHIDALRQDLAQSPVGAWRWLWDSTGQGRAVSTGEGRLIVAAGDRERMAAAAADWVASLGPSPGRGVYGFPAWEERTRWHYVPTQQLGLPMAEMGPEQQLLAHRLIASGLSRPGYATAAAIMGLENVLAAKEDWRSGYPGRPDPQRYRDPQLYFVSVFGDPGGDAWGWRVGGHHVSVNYTVVGDQVAPGPVFFGANPAATPLVGPGKLRPLAGEQDLGLALLSALDPARRSRAVISPVAPEDIVQGNRPQVERGVLPRRLWQLYGFRLDDRAVARYEADQDQQREELGLGQAQLEALRYTGEPSGLAAADMTVDQRRLLDELVHQYLGRLPEALAEEAAERAGPLHFAWAGDPSRGFGQYYRVQGPRLLIEYDNTQDGANHVHAVWRDPAGDFGAGLLGR